MAGQRRIYIHIYINIYIHIYYIAFTVTDDKTSKFILVRCTGWLYHCPHQAFMMKQNHRRCRWLYMNENVLTVRKLQWCNLKRLNAYANALMLLFLRQTIHIVCSFALICGKLHSKVYCGELQHGHNWRGSSSRRSSMPLPLAAHLPTVYWCVLENTFKQNIVCEFCNSSEWEVK